MKPNPLWFFVGNGKKIHAFRERSVYAKCGIGGFLSGPVNPDDHERCQTCISKLASSDNGNQTTMSDSED